LLTDRLPAEVDKLKKSVASGVRHPIEVKMELAREIIAGYHGEEKAEGAKQHFQRVFRDRQSPEQTLRIEIAHGPPKRLSALLVELKLVASRNEGDRLIKQGGVEIDGVRVEDVRREVDLSEARVYLLRAGKRKFVRLAVV
jgi:tyrosyl-tRNA synthetase